MATVWDLAIQYGTIHLNSAFTKTRGKRRLGKTSIRFSGADIFWGIVSMVPFTLILALIIWPLTYLPVVGTIFGWHMLIAGPIFGFLMGPRIAALFSPYKDSTGEGLLEYMLVNRDRARRQLIWKLNGGKTTVGEVESIGTGKRKIVKAFYWLGTAPSPHVPLENPRTNNPFVNLEFTSLAIETDWIDRQNAKTRFYQDRKEKRR